MSADVLGQAPGIPDDAFARGGVPMTKMEVRAVALGKARIAADSHVLDVGAGTGALAIEASLRCLRGHVVALERNAEALALLRKNAVHFGALNLTIAEGEAPAAFATLGGPFEIALVGGGGRALPDILAALPALLVTNARVVVNTIGLTSTAAALDVLGRAPWGGRECVQVSVAHAEPIGPDLRLVPANPVFITSAVLAEGGVR